MRNIGSIAAPHPWAGASVSYEDSTGAWYVNGQPVDAAAVNSFHGFIQQAAAPTPQGYRLAPPGKKHTGLKVGLGILAALLLVGGVAIALGIGNFMNQWHGNGMSEAQARTYLTQKYPDLQIDKMHTEQYIGQATIWHFSEKSNPEVDFQLRGAADAEHTDTYISATERTKVWNALKPLAGLDRYPKALIRTPLGSRGIQSGESAEEWFAGGQKIFVYIPESEYSATSFPGDMASFANRRLVAARAHAATSTIDPKMVDCYIEVVVVPDSYVSTAIADRYEPSNLLSVASEACDISESQYSDTPPIAEFTAAGITAKYAGIHTEVGSGNQRGITLYFFRNAFDRWNDPGNKNNGPKSILLGYKEDSTGYSIFSKDVANYDRLWSDKRVYATPFEVGGSHDIRGFGLVIDRSVFPTDADVYYFNYYNGGSGASAYANGPSELMPTLNGDGIHYYDTTNTQGVPADLFVAQRGVTKW